MTINQYMTEDHRRCDELLSEAESNVSIQEWEKADQINGQFRTAMLHHFDMEEKIMFPEFNQNASGGCNPTQVMIMEHDQMRELLNRMNNAIAEKDQNKFLGLSESLMILMQQHNMKEEQIMYNLADDALPSEQIIQKMEALG